MWQGSGSRPLPRDFRGLASVAALRAAPPRAHAALLAVDRATAATGVQSCQSTRCSEPMIMRNSQAVASAAHAAMLAIDRATAATGSH